MTHPTKAIYKWLIQDSVRVSSTTSTSDTRTALYTEQDHINTLPQIETIDFYTTHTISGIRVTPYPAGHVLGAAMFLINIAGLNIFFTGDYSREPDRHLVSATVPDLSKTGPIDLLITESTFGISSAPPRAEREAALLKSISSIIGRGGKVLMPVFALGRAQELLLILEDYWSRHPELQKTPIYYTGNTARKCMVVYQTYINAMNENIKRIFRERMAEAEQAGSDRRNISAGPWDFRYVRSLRNLDRFEDVGSCVMLASPGMLQSGMSRMLLERWAPDARNGVVMTGYNVEGTMARYILTEPDTISAIMSGSNANTSGQVTKRGKDGDDTPQIPRRCTVEEFSFAAHVTGVENVEFIEEVNAPHVILVHGERSQAARLRSRLIDLNNRKASAGTAQTTKVYSPENGTTVKIPFRKDKIAKVVGRLAEQPPPSKPGETREIQGVIVQNGFKLSLMAAEDLKEYAGLTSTTVLCRQQITLAAASIELIQWALEGTFGGIEELTLEKSATTVQIKDGTGTKDEEVEIKQDGAELEIADEEIVRNPARMFIIMGCVKLTWTGSHNYIELEWEGNAMNDGIADAVMAVLMTVESSPAAVKYSSRRSHNHDHNHNHKHARSNGDVKPNGTSHEGDKPRLRNQHAYLTPQDRFSRLCMFLEEQFGNTITPIETPRLPEHVTAGKTKHEKSDGSVKSEGDSESSDDEEAGKEREIQIARERARLAALGIPVPGLTIQVDKDTATVWLDDLTVECPKPVLRDRVRAVVERAVEVVAPLSGGYE